MRRSCDRCVGRARLRTAEADPARLGRDRPGPAHAAELLGDGEARLQAVLVEAGAEVGAAEPGAAPTLQRPEPGLRTDRRRIEERMLVALAAKDELRARLADRIERQEE